MKKVNISFKENEIYLYNHLKSKRSASNYVKDLIEDDIKKSEIEKGEK